MVNPLDLLYVAKSWEQFAFVVEATLEKISKASYVTIEQAVMISYWVWLKESQWEQKQTRFG